MKRILVIGGIAVTGLVLLTGFYGRSGGCGGGVSSEEGAKRAYQFITWRADDALSSLDATDDQKKQVHGLKDSLFNEGKEVFARNREVRAELVAEWNAAQPDSTKVHRLVDERLDDLRGFAHKAADAALELHRILTPEQRKTVTTQVQERIGRH